MPTEELKKAAKTGPANSSPRRKLAVARTHNSTKATASQAAPSKKANSGEIAGGMCQENLGRDHLHHTRMSLFHLHPVESMRTAAREQHPQAKAAASRACPFVDNCAGDTDMQRVQTARLVPLLSQISGEGFGKAAVKAGTPGKAAAAGSTAWAPSPSRFRRTTQENTQPAPTSRKVTAFCQVWKHVW